MPIRVLACSVPLTGLGELLLSSMRAYTRVMLPAVIRSFIAPGLRVVAAAGALLAHSDLVRVAVAYTLVEGVALVLSAVAAHRVLPGRSAGILAPPTAEIVRFSWPLAINRVLNGSTNNAEVFLLGALAGSARWRCSRPRAASPSWPTPSSSPSAPSFRRWCRPGRRRSGRPPRPPVQGVEPLDLTIGVPVFLVQVLFGEALLATFGRGFTQGQPP